MGRRGPSTETRQQVYLHNFLPEQPDLNWRNPEVVAAMHDTLRFWLDRGVDGFRIDVIHLLGKPESLPSIPTTTSLASGESTSSTSTTRTRSCATSARCSTATTATA